MEKARERGTPWKCSRLSGNLHPRTKASKQIKVRGENGRAEKQIHQNLRQRIYFKFKSHIQFISQTPSRPHAF